MNSNGVHAPGASAGTQTFNAALSYQFGAQLVWELVGNTTTGPDTNFDQVVAASTVNVSGAALDVVLNGLGSVVSFNNVFWSQSRTWTVVASSAVNGTFALGTVSPDAAGLTESAYGNFATARGPTGLTLDWTPLPKQAWRGTHFGAAWTNLAIAGELANPDGDGLLNVWEYLYGTNPTTATTGSPLQAITASGKLSVTFPRDTAAADLTLRVQGADNPNGPWTNLAQSVNGAPFMIVATGASVTETEAGPVRSVTVSDLYLTSDPAHPRRFLRLQVQY